MNLNAYLIRFALSILIIFGGAFVIHYLKTDDLLFGQMIGVGVGMVVLLSALMWRKRNGGVQER